MEVLKVVRAELALEDVFTAEDVAYELKNLKDQRLEAVCRRLGRAGTVAACGLPGPSAEHFQSPTRTPDGVPDGRLAPLAED